MNAATYHLEQVKAQAFVRVQWDVYYNGALSYTVGPFDYHGESGDMLGCDFGENLEVNFNPASNMLVSSATGGVYTTTVTMTHLGAYLPMRWDFSHNEYDVGTGTQVGGDIAEFFQLSGASSTKTFSATNTNCSCVYFTLIDNFKSPG